MAGQNQKVRACPIILQRLIPQGQQSLDERKKQGNLLVGCDTEGQRFFRLEAKS